MTDCTKMRSNAFTFVYFPNVNSDTADGIPSNELSINDFSLDFCFLRDYLESMSVPFCISPLHNLDVDEIQIDNGHDILIQEVVERYKKPHFHVLIWLDKTQKSYYQWLEIVSPLERAAIVNIPMNDEGKFARFFKRTHYVMNLRGLLRYFTHKDNPEKFQYDINDITVGCGFSYDEHVLSQTDSISISKEMIQFCKNNNIYIFCDFVDYCIEFNPEWYSVLLNSRVESLLKDYIKSSVYRDTGYIDRKLDSLECPSYPDRRLWSDDFNN